MIKYRHQEDQQEHERLSRTTSRSFKNAEVRTIQSEKRNCDLNFMVARFGIGPLARPIDPTTFGEVNRDLDLQSAYALIQDANEKFDGLPAKVRRRFNNDPLELLAAIKDPERREEMELLGIFKAEPVQPPQQEAAPVDPPSSKKKDPKPAATE